MNYLRPVAGVALMLAAFAQILFSVVYLAEDMLAALWGAPVDPGRPANAYALVLLLTAPALMATGLLAFRGLRRLWVRTGAAAAGAVGMLGFVFQGPPALALLTVLVALGLAAITFGPFPPPPETPSEPEPRPAPADAPGTSGTGLDLGDRLLLAVVVVSLCGLAVGLAWTLFAS